MEYPEEYELMAIFESEPDMLDSTTDVPFYYNKSTYKYSNPEKEVITFSMTPSYDEVSIKVSKENFEIANMNLQHISSLSVLSDNKEEKRIMLTGRNYVLKVQLKPRFNIQFAEELAI
ncbi:hypothetical protein [uncultured Pontibacter sp.]|uniref:hypothetical protein n=1 Tax=uncultured Pontibacter sp. TaxID=453356 RepID=UPI002637861B|nr:hypothetical protein [uncultured Pontibacter sp.]